jgi:hypothetical protein
MRPLTLTLLAGYVLVPAGCQSWMNRGGAVAETTPVNQPAPPVKDLVDYLNKCSALVNSIQSPGLYMDCKAGNESASLTGNMVCEKPRNFRLKGGTFGSSECDIGSNSEEFWYWIKRDNPPYLYHCSYEAMSRGNVRLPFPFQPDMVVAALGMAEYDPDLSKYELKVLPKSLELSENTTAGGQPVRRVTVFARGSVDVSKGRPQVTDYILRDAQGRDVCKATVERVAVQRSGAIVPQKVRLSWPAQKMEMALTLNSVTINAVDPQFSKTVFNRSTLPYQPFDLARGAPDAGSANIQRVRGNMP